MGVGLGLRERKGRGCEEWRRRGVAGVKRGLWVKKSGGGERKRAVALMASVWAFGMSK